MSLLKGLHVLSLALPLVSLKGPIKGLSAIHITFMVCGNCYCRGQWAKLRWSGQVGVSGTW